jgi:hypothetical protein
LATHATLEISGGEAGLAAEHLICILATTTTTAAAPAAAPVVRVVIRYRKMYNGGPGFGQCEKAEVRNASL